MALRFARRLISGQRDVRERVMGMAEQIQALHVELQARVRDTLVFEDLLTLAHLAGVLTTGDYSQATLAMRELTVADALAQAERTAAEWGVQPDQALPPGERLVDLLARQYAALQDSLGLERASGTDKLRRSSLENLPRVLQGGDLHARFWHWLDRFYLELYRPWREARAAVMAAQERRALALLGAESGQGHVPPLAWLGAQSPLHIFTTVHDAVQVGRLALHFWVDPVGSFDSWSLFPDMVLVSFAEPGHLLATFQEHAGDVARRSFALADGTRLTILRIIRHYAMDNTQLANYLGLSRPTVSIHAKVLREAGLIETAKEGRAVRHRVNAPAVRQLFRDLEQFLDLPKEPES